MKSIKIALILFAVLIILLNTRHSSSQMKMGVGTFSCIFNGDTLSFGLNTDLNDLYYMTMGGTAEFGLIKIQWDGAKTPADVKVQSLQLEKGFVSNETEKISIIWADFYTNLPNVIKSGKFAVTSNSGSTISGTLELTAELGGSSVLGDFLKGKKEAVMTNGRFEINY